MNKFVLILLLMGGLSACATNNGTTSGDTGNEAVAQEAESGRKKVCKYERSSSAGSRMERVCRWVDTSE